METLGPPLGSVGAAEQKAAIVRSSDEVRAAAFRYQTMSLLRAARRRGRDGEIVALFNQGMRVSELAQRFKLSRTRIYQIMRTPREELLP